MPDPVLLWNLPDTYLATPGLRRVVLPADLAARYPAGLGSPNLAAADVAVLDGVLVLGPRVPLSYDLQAEAIDEASPGAKSVWGPWGVSGSWLLLATAGLSSWGWSGYYARMTPALARGQWFRIDTHLFVPETPALFSWQLGFGNTFALRVGADGIGGLWENSEGSYQLRAESRLFQGAIWQRHLALGIAPLRRDTVYISSSDGNSLVWRNPRPVSSLTPTLRQWAFEGATVDLGIAQAKAQVLWRPGTWDAADSSGIAVVRGPLQDLHQTFSGGLGAVVATDLAAGTSVIGSLQDQSGNLATGGRYVRPLLAVSTSDPKVTPYVYGFGIVAQPVSGTALLSQVDLSDAWEEISWGNSTEDLSADVQVRMVPSVTEASLSGYLRRYSGLSVDGTSWLRAYLSPTTETAGPYDRVVLRGRGRLSRLENCLFDWQETFAGLTHTEAMRQVLAGAGLVEGQDYTVTADPAPSPVLMPSADGETDDPTTPAIGTNRREFAQYLCNFVSGWVLLEQADGVLVYQPRQGTHQGTWVEDGVAGIDPNRWILADSWMEELDTERFRNEVWVIGENCRGEALLAVYLNAPSQADPTAADYVGERRLLIYADPSLTDEDRVQQALDYIVADVAIMRRRARFRSVADHTVQPGDQLTARGREWGIASRRISVTGPNVTAWVDYEVQEYAT